MTKSILIVDDHEELADLIAYGFEFHGYQTTVAYSGEKACDIIDSHVLDAVLCDLSLSGISGLEVYRHLLDKRDNVVFILISGLVDVTHYKKFGINNVVYKPVDLSTLVDYIDGLIEDNKGVIE